MNLRLRLILAFLFVAITLLALFGLLANRAALESGDDRQLALLQNLAEQQLKTNALGTLLARAKPDGQLWAVRSADAIWRAAPAGEWPLVGNELESTFGASLQAGSRRGVVTANGLEFIWVAFSQVDGTIIVRMHPRDQSESAAHSNLTARLFVMGIVLVWLAVWAAIYMANRITRRQERYQTELRHMALHDSLTNLPNRLLLDDRLDQAIRSAKRKRSYVAVLMLDMDNFKEINDTLGHQVGDLALKDISHKLRLALRESDTVARFGGDEFCIVAPVAVYEETLGLVQKIQEEFKKPFLLGQTDMLLEASIGGALFPVHGEDPATLIRHADVAMYVAKRNRNGFNIYETADDQYNLNRLSLVCDIRRALEENQMTVLYQPKVDMKSGKINSVEALVRWRHPERGVISPEVFVPLAEESGSVEQLTFHVLRQALLQVREWEAQGIHTAMAVNLSAGLLHNEHLPLQIKDILAETGARPDQLLLEITESAIMSDPKRAMRVASLLAEDGVRLAIDDFGSGYSSLSYLKAFPVEELKIDKSFVMNMNADRDNAHIVRTTIDLGHSLGLRVVAEGVETQAVWQRLYTLNCNTAQGYYLGAPQSGEDLTEMLLSKSKAHG